MKDNNNVKKKIKEYEKEIKQIEVHNRTKEKESEYKWLKSEARYLRKWLEDRKKGRDKNYKQWWKS